MWQARRTGDDRFMEPTDSRNRPVVLEAGVPADAPVRRRPRPRTVLALSSAAVLAAGGVLAGSWSVWSAVNPVTPHGTPAPLWFSPPAPVITTSETSAPPSGAGHDRGDDDPPGDDHSRRGTGGKNGSG
jgi:hypothetical protein